ncbi:MAG: DUF4268 domain-containing protein [Candidatus Delongbacteria bacterium]|nr:DUF4268 domain-containing protein [Candidatus Delongbacteria bacterium]
MFLINSKTNRIQKMQERSFSELGFKERENLQEWIANNSNALGEELLFIQKEFDGFDDTKERLDLMALDKEGNIVVIENKLDDTGRDVTWQVLKYASYCASLSKQQIKDIYQRYLDLYSINEDAETNLSEFFDSKDFDDLTLNKFQRVILIAGNFRKEVTSTVLWLLNNYKLRIQCFKVTPYSHKDELYLNIEQIIPIKEAEEYIISMAVKAQEDNVNQEELKNRHKIRLEFWKKLLEQINSTEITLYQNISPSKDNWISAGIGISGVGLNFVVSRSYARVEIYCSRSSQEENKFIFDELIKNKDEITKESGIEFTWQRMDSKKASRIKVELQGVSLYELTDWDKMISFMIENVDKMEKPFRKQLQKINRKLKNL